MRGARLGLLVFTVFRTASGSDDLGGWLDTASALVLAEEGVRVQDVTVTLGHLTISVANGIAVPILGKGGNPLGCYFEGAAGWRYTVTDPARAESLRASVERAGKGLRVTGNDVGDVVSKFVVLFTEPTMKEIWAPVTDGKAPLPPGGRESAAEILAKIASSYPEFDFRLAQARLNGHGRWAYAEFVGGVERAGFVYDDLRSGAERLFNFRNIAGYEARFTQTLASQDLGSWTVERRSWVVLEHADIHVATPDNRSGTIVSDLRLRVATGTRVVPLDLSSTFDPDAKNWDSPKYRLEVKRVTDGSGKELAFSHKYHELLVEIPASEGVGGTVPLHVETEGEVFLDMNGRHDDNYFIFQQNGWLPQPAAWIGTRMSYTLEVRTKKPWRPVTSGKQLSVVDEGTSTVVRAESARSSTIIAILGGKYVTKSETIDGRSIRAHAYATARKNVLENLPKLTAGLVKFYSNVLGEMPAEELEVVEIPEYGFGISPSGIVLLTSEAYRARDDDIAQYLSRGINNRLAHEVAHQWFFHKAMDANPSEQWLSESFAEYWAGLAMGALASSDTSIAGFPRMLAEWRADNKICEDIAPISAANTLGGAGASMERRCLLYMRGPLVLHMLRTMIGNERFAAATKLYLDRANMGPATTDDFARAVSDTVGQDMRWYFDQWIRSSGTPTVQVDHHVTAGPNGTYRLHGTMRQAAGPKFKRLFVPLVYDLGGKTEGKVVVLDQPEKTFEFTIGGKPSGVKVDPFQNNLAVYR